MAQEMWPEKFRLLNAMPLVIISTDIYKTMFETGCINSINLNFANKIFNR